MTEKKWEIVTPNGFDIYYSYDNKLYAYFSNFNFSKENNTNIKNELFSPEESDYDIIEDIHIMVDFLDLYEVENILAIKELIGNESDENSFLKYCINNLIAGGKPANYDFALCPFKKDGHWVALVCHFLLEDKKPEDEKPKYKMEFYEFDNSGCEEISSDMNEINTVLKNNEKPLITNLHRLNTGNSLEKINNKKNICGFCAIRFIKYVFNNCKSFAEIIAKCQDKTIQNFIKTDIEERFRRVALKIESENLSEMSNEMPGVPKAGVEDIL